MLASKTLRHLVLLVILPLLFCSCGPKVLVTIQKKYPTTDYRQNIEVLGLGDNIPENSEKIGEIKVGDTGVSINCGYDVGIRKAKEEARKMGGNIIKLADHKTPDILSSCHRMLFVVLRQEDVEEVLLEEGYVDSDNEVTTTVKIPGKALIYIFRLHGDYAETEFDLYLEDNLLCRVSDNFKTSVYVSKLGHLDLWTEVEYVVKVKIDIEADKEYFLQCDVLYNGDFPQAVLKLIDRQEGKQIYDSLNTDGE